MCNYSSYYYYHTFHIIAHLIEEKSNDVMVIEREAQPQGCVQVTDALQNMRNKNLIWASTLFLLWPRIQFKNIPVERILCTPLYQTHVTSFLDFLEIWCRSLMLFPASTWAHPANFNAPPTKMFHTLLHCDAIPVMAMDNARKVIYALSMWTTCITEEVCGVRACVMSWLLQRSSVASFCYWGGGGARPPNVPTEEKKSFIILLHYMRCLHGAVLYLAE